MKGEKATQSLPYRLRVRNKTQLVMVLKILTSCIFFCVIRRVLSRLYASRVSVWDSHNSDYSVCELVGVLFLSS